MNSHKYCVGLSGNIASGKSTVAQLFKDYGINIISADEISKALTSQGTMLSQAIITHFGPKSQTADGSIDRKYLRQLISNNATAKQWLEDCLHPIIRQEIAQQVAKSNAPYTLIEIPLLNKREDYPYIDSILIVIADIKTQIQRIIKRDHCTEQEAKAILNTQPSIEMRRQLADDIIDNNGSKAELTKYVQILHQKYLKAATANF